MTKNSTIYNPQQIEEKWQAFWEKEGLFQGVALEAAKNPLYLLIAFPYPSGSGLHVGHVESKTALDIVARHARMNGRDVFFPIGWDSFGLPAENYAVKTGVHPAETTVNAINTFRRQIKRVGISYDWTAEVATSHPGYYKWTQWIFLELFKKGLAYQEEAPVNWCPSCQTVLANEQVVDGHCERCDHEVIQKEMKQWFFKITDYKQELIDDLEKVDWPNATKAQQLNWIGRKEGINITYQVEGADEEIVCFTTRPDTNFGATFIVLAPEHSFAEKIASGAIKPAQNGDIISQEVAAYLEEADKKTELERLQEGKKKTGAFTGFYAVNNLNGTKLPIWVSDFVLGGFGTGAVVGVPGHDKRDFEFAQAFSIPVVRVVEGAEGDTSEITSIDQVQEDTGKMINSDFLDGMEIMDAIEAMKNHLEEKGWGERITSYKLRDWLISRQRYWGAPIPIVYDPEGNPHPVKEEHLPWELPTDVDFKPTGESPLVSSEAFNKRTEELYGTGWKPEYDTMDTFVDSSWYYLRYPDARNEAAFASKEQLEKWLPVDTYMIGPEHIVLHLLYSRFFTKALRDSGYLNFDEPFMKMRHQGMILGPDHKKMSKSKGNVINPDDVIEKFGADTLRVYEMFMGPIEADKPWDTSAVTGVYRFLNRVHRLIVETVIPQAATQTHPDVARKLHQTIKQVGDQIPELKFNTAIAALMELLNTIEAVQKNIGSKNSQSLISIDGAISLVKLLAPFAPFITEELFVMLTQASGEKAVQTSIHTTAWPVFDANTAAESVVTIPVQVNGKVRGQLTVDAQMVQDTQQVLAAAKQLDKLSSWIAGKAIQKEIYVPGKIINLVV
jgi:leucyl-tRNA synthetase